MGQRGALHRKVCGAFVVGDAARRQKTTLFTIITTLLNFSMTIVFAGQMKVDERKSLPAQGARGTPSRRPPRSSTADRRDQNAVVPGRVGLAAERKGS